MTVSNWLLIAALGWWAPAGVGELRLNISSTMPGQGEVYVAVFKTQANFEARSSACFEKVLPTASRGSTRLSVPQLPEGSYAVAAFQDLNKNGKLDTNSMGIPQEPYAFSRNPRAKWRAPSYGETVFAFSAAGADLSLHLKNWSER